MHLVEKWLLLPLNYKRCKHSGFANLLHGQAKKTRKGQIVVIFGQHFSQEMENKLNLVRGLIYNRYFIM